MVGETGLRAEQLGSGTGWGSGKISRWARDGEARA